MSRLPSIGLADPQLTDAALSHGPPWLGSRFGIKLAQARRVGARAATREGRAGCGECQDAMELMTGHAGQRRAGYALDALERKQ
jgi:hypothetical protein